MKDAGGLTYRERRERRAERLREWASSRETKAASAFGKSQELADSIPFGQPILVGHHSEAHARRDQERIVNGMRQGLEHSRMAEGHKQRADNIEVALGRSIYSDDPDALEQLRTRIAALEAERDRIKAYNASCRKGQRDLSLLDDAQRADLESLVRVASWQLGKGGAFPTYKLSNLNGNISRNRERLSKLESEVLCAFCNFTLRTHRVDEELSKEHAFVAPQ